MRSRRTAGGGILATVAGMLLVSCAAPSAQTGDPATWELADGAGVSVQSTTIEVLATRLACASGVTGALEDPVVDYRDDEIVIRIDAVYDGDAAADCQGNNAVPVSVALTEPVGDRVLVDGACRLPPAADTAFCESPVRWSP
ncbi:MAG: hypothetical protein EOO67_04715 [Microbacterium sp.]|nr:MAG: hypothetical protein EOO67_04715 [Microbacterium sp.]